jgi:hypothetical protein
MNSRCIPLTASASFHIAEDELGVFRKHVTTWYKETETRSCMCGAVYRLIIQSCGSTGEGEPSRAEKLGGAKKPLLELVPVSEQVS